LDPRHIFIDQRLAGVCVYCGREPTTRDHVPSLVLLDEPYPNNLPVVDACDECNQSFSRDERYVACLIECAMTGTVDPSSVERDKIRRILEKNPRLRNRLYKSKKKDESGNLIWEAEVERVRTVALKIARGHAAFELGQPQLEEPTSIFFCPFVAMSDEQKTLFESAPTSSTLLWPEIGCRAFIRAAKNCPISYVNDWIIVQPNRYRYFVDHTEGLAIQIVLSEYLACRVVWLDI
jgi:hypothetical protein